MSTPPMLEPAEEAQIEAILARYEQELGATRRVAENLRILFSEDALTKLIHSMKVRVKDPSHLRGKLVRKLLKSKEGGPPFDITPDNLLEKINDLAGARLLHLHTTQFPQIDGELRRLFEEEKYELLEGPTARVWDGEYRGFFERSGVSVIDSSDRLYTSVHYVVSPTRRTPRTAEIQVRTLAEELWGEVDHAINYPQPSAIAACREQIKVLARLTTSCTRLVDSIFFSFDGER